MCGYNTPDTMVQKRSVKVGHEINFPKSRELIATRAGSYPALLLHSISGIGRIPFSSSSLPFVPSVFFCPFPLPLAGSSSRVYTGADMSTPLVPRRGDSENDSETQKRG